MDPQLHRAATVGPDTPPRRAAGPDQKLRLRPAGVAEQLPEVALPVAQIDHPRVRARLRQLPRPVQAGDPSGAVPVRRLSLSLW